MWDVTFLCHHTVKSVYSSSSPETNEYILFVHGWRMQPFEKKYYAETAYKRLFWQGYKGRFGTYDWPTEWVGESTAAKAKDPQNFDRSEQKAFWSAAGLNSLLRSLDTQCGGYAHVNVLAHSMGNVVVSEALRQAGTTKLVHTYVASQAAFAANAYNSIIPWRPSPTNGWETPDVYSNYPATPGQAYFANIGGAADSLVNFFNSVDYALDWWTTGQNAKPDVQYTYQDGYFDRLSSLLKFPADTYEIFAFAAEAHSAALGATNNIGGPFTSQVNLQTTFGFTDAPSDHSAQFLSTYPVRRAYWARLLSSFGL